MESSVPMFNKLQEVLKTVGDEGFELPQIVVVGSQSCGKSSVLEKIVGRSFLPRGPGIVTRTPLELQLVHSPQQSRPLDRRHAAEYGVFQDSNMIFTDFEKIRDVIQRRTNRIAGTNKGISDEVISLKIYSPRVVNLTLVELPGLTNVPVGDQPSDIDTLIRNLVLKYIQKPNSIIMAVVPAISGTIMNEILKLANDCDPEGYRTLTVVTKLDLMDAGTDATDLLSGRVIPVKLGIIAVINMSQKDINMSQIDDINSKKPTITGQIDETEFLLEKYPSLADCNGTPFLVKTLDKLLVKHIKDYLPGLRIRLQLVINQQEDLYYFYKESVDLRFLQNVVEKISSLYSNKITAFSENFEIRTVFDDIKYNFNYQLDDEPLCATTSVCKSTEISLLLNNAIDKGSFLLLRREDFSVLMKRTIDCLTEPSLRCLEFAYDKMKDLLAECFLEMEPMMQRFPSLRDNARELLEDMLTERREYTKVCIEFEYAHELDYTNTRPSYFGEEGVLIDKEESQKELVIGKFRESFINSVQMAARDIVEKNVIQYFVNFVNDNVQGELSRYMDTEQLLQEADEIEEIRRQAFKVLEDLFDATHIIEAIEGESNTSLLTVPFKPTTKTEEVINIINNPLNISLPAAAPLSPLASSATSTSHL